MYRFFGQPKFIFTNNESHHVGYEFFLRQETPDGWRLPADFSLVTAADLNATISKVLGPLSSDLRFISVNLEPAHFIREDFIRTVIAVQEHFHTHLIVELVERADHNVTVQDLMTAAKQFHAAGVSVCLDDVGTGNNVGALVDMLDKYVDEYKFAMQNLRPFNAITEITPQLTHWYKRAQRLRKAFAIEGIETQAELDYINAHYPGMLLQGYFLGKPEILPVTDDGPTPLD